MRRHDGAISLRAWLVILALLGGVGALLVAAVAGWASWNEEKKQVGLSFLATSRAMTGAVDRELDQAVALARGLATSVYLANGDLHGFEGQARRALASYGYALILNPADSGRQLINTQVAEGEKLPEIPTDSDWIAPGVPSGNVAVKPLRRSHVTGHWIAVVQVPITALDGAARYVINIVIPASAFQQIIEEQHLPADWNPVIVDTEWTVVARRFNAEKYVGDKAATRWLQNSPQDNLIYETHFLEGAFALSAWSRSTHYGWSVGLGMPESLIFRQYVWPVLLSASIGFLVAAIALGAVAFVTLRLIRGVRALADGMEALAHRQPVQLPALRVRELALIGDGMQRAAAQLDGQARQLEARVAEVTRELRQEAEERQKAEAALAHAQRLEALGQLTGGMAHDFNNLLTVISGNLELIAARLNSAELGKFVQAAQWGVARGARLIESLLAFARKQPLHPRTQNLNWLIKQFVPIIKGAAGDAVEVQLLLSPTLHPCRVDAVQFQSAILNLATNASAAMPRGGRLSIETENVEIGSTGEASAELTPGTYVRVAVSDTGIGMPPEVVAHAFEPFFTTREVSKGSGLGLAQVYGFAKQSGGHAELRSEIGIGTTVRLYLPRSLDADAPAAISPLEETSLTSRSGRMTVLVVDDDPDVRSALASQVGALGHTALVAQEGREALELLQCGVRVDVVITDYSMPNGMTGADLCRRIAELDPAIATIVISGYAMPQVEDFEAGLRLLCKPIRQAELDRAIREALQRSARP